MSGPDVVVAVGDLAVAAWGHPEATESLRGVLDEALAAPDAVAILRPVHNPDGEVADFEVAWSNRPRPELAGAPLETSVRAATRRIGPGKVDLFAQLVEVLHRQAPADLSGLDIVAAGTARPLVAGLDITLAPLGDAVVCTWQATTDPDRALRSLEDREQLFRTALDAILDPVTIAVPVHAEDGAVADFELVWCNRAHLAVEGSRPGSSMRAAAHTMPSVDILEAHRRVHETGVPMVLDDVRVESTDQSGGLVEMFTDVGIARFGAGLLTSYRPATERIRAQQELQESERLFRSVFDEAPRGTLLFSLDESCLGRCLRVNPAFQELSGYTEEEFLEGGWPLVVPHDEVERTRGAVRRDGGRPRPPPAPRLPRAAGGRRARRRPGRLLRRHPRRPARLLRRARRGHHRAPPRRVRGLVAGDARPAHRPAQPAPVPAPGAARPRPARAAAGHARRPLRRRPGRRRAARTASVLLTEVARRLADCVRRSDTPARLRGGDFAVLLPEVGGPEGARRLARRIAEALEPDVPLPDGDTPLRARVGTAITGDADADAVNLVRNARLDVRPEHGADAAFSEVVQPRQRDV